MLVLNNEQGEMKPVHRGFGNQEYLIINSSGERVYAPYTVVKEALEQYYSSKYSRKQYKRR